jgi:hypothetical protein
MLGIDTRSEPGLKIKGQNRMMEMRIHWRHLERVHLHLNLFCCSLLIPIPTLISIPQAREICTKFTRGVDFSWQAQALLALQEAAEAFLVHLRTPTSSPYMLAESLSSPGTCSWPGGSQAFRKDLAECSVLRTHQRG